jgi:hypothetical protein
MSKPDPSASPSPQQRSASTPSELSGKELRRAIAAQRRKYEELRQQPGAGLRAYWNSRILGGLLAEQQVRRERHAPRPRGEASRRLAAESSNPQQDGE